MSGIEGSVPLQTEAEYDTIMLVKNATYSEGSRFDSLLENHIFTRYVSYILLFFLSLRIISY